jgi:murein DD-endopeptidase MepM/ murein hydrolase activator NlpD
MAAGRTLASIGLLALTAAISPSRSATVVRQLVAAPSTRSLATAAVPRRARPSSYGWPVRPFDRQHPVRGNFADPRTTFRGQPTRDGLMTGPCACSFHQGIDIAAPDGTAVYPVVSGTVTIVTPDWVQVDSDGGQAFQYWHVGAVVRRGDRVEARRTVLGHVLRGSLHVHLTELRDGNAVNPLAAGHIGPYADRTTPRVTAITFRTSDTGPELLPEYVHGRVEIVAAAEDTPAVPVPGVWHGLPISPARLTFRIRRIGPKPVGLVVRDTVAMDTTRRLPATPVLWHTYARGTRMNMANFGPHRYWFQPGVYLFKLTPEELDTRDLADGVYRITVEASDVAGNTGSASQIFSVHNRSGWLR